MITIVVLALVGGAYYAYYRKQVEYFTGRNLRLLGMLTAQVEGRVEMLEGFVRAQDKADAQNKTDNTDHSGKNAERAYSATRIRFGDCVVETPSIPPTPSSDTDEVRRGIEETSQGWRVRLQAHDGQKARTCATIAIDDMARPIFAGKAGAAFDMLLVAKDDGTVLYSVRPPPASSKLLGNGEEWIDEGEEPPPTEAMSATTTQTNAADAPGSVVEKTATTATASAATTTTTTASATAGSPKMSAAIGDRESGSTLLITSLMALSKRKAGWRSDYEPVDAPTLA
ncbi:MAG TPA: hypothetical protein VGA84_08400, partial [Thermoanaerobaculia bacterium]